MMLKILQEEGRVCGLFKRWQKNKSELSVVKATQPCTACGTLVQNILDNLFLSCGCQVINIDLLLTVDLVLLNKHVDCIMFPPVTFITLICT